MVMADKFKKLHEHLDYGSADELANKIDWEGGLWEWLLNYGECPDPFPQHEHAQTFRDFMKLAKKVEGIFAEEGAILE